MSDRLMLKWGTVKGWSLESEAARSAGQKYLAAGPQALGAMQQADSDEQKKALCELIDVIDGEIKNDWSGEIMTKEQAKAYVLEYRNP